jgi:hypothetical protein
MGAVVVRGFACCAHPAQQANVGAGAGGAATGNSGGEVDRIGDRRRLCAASEQASDLGGRQLLLM